MSQIGRWVKGLLGGRAAEEQAAAATAGAAASAARPAGDGAPVAASSADVPRPASSSGSAKSTEAKKPEPKSLTTANPEARNPEARKSDNGATSAKSPDNGGTAKRPAAKAAAPAGAMTSSRFLPVVLGISGIGLSLWMMHEYSSFVAPIFFALNMMITAYPLYRIQRRYRVPTVIAVLVTGLTVIALLALFLFGMYWAVAAMVQKLPDYNSQFAAMYTDTITWLAGLGLSEEMLRDQVMSIDPSQLAGVVSGVLASMGNVGTLLVVMITALIFMLMDTPQMQERLDIASRNHGSFIGALGNFAVGIRRYWIVTTVFGLIVAVLDLAVLIGLGVPLALVWAVFSFLTNYIPNIGFVIGLVPPALLALVDSGPRTAIAVVVAYSVLNFVVQSIIQPKFAGNAVGLTPTLSFISLMLWTAVLGPLGALLALPMSLLVKALLIDPDPQSRWVNALISSRPQDAISAEPVEEPELALGND
ncbi:AI-2E family transporter [Propionibacteriaceae bacterium Y1923]|uniref:AI-2E family transporter n=1 Tax=Aestuariimicrobium sp. Y1814 TaxID=3418742 RepID=UPI003C270F98